MILEVHVNNFRVFSNEVGISLVPDMRTKRLSENIYFGHSFSALKSACIYGPNNVGKSCFIDAISVLKAILSGTPIMIFPDILEEHNACDLGIEFSVGEDVYSYDFKYDSNLVNNQQIGFCYERFAKVEFDLEKRETTKIIYEFDTNKNIFNFPGHDDISSIMSIMTHNIPLLFALNPKKFADIDQYQKICRSFASSITIIRDGVVNVDKTLNEFKNHTEASELILNLIKAADLDIDDFGYDSNVPISYPKEKYEINTNRNVNQSGMEEIRKIYSTRKGDKKSKKVPSLYIDSVGTRRLASLAGYVVDAILNDKILIVDELGNSLHFKLTKAIISMFNSETNRAAQFIFTTHDTALLDTISLFRKDQIWFMQKEDGKQYLYPLSDFTAAQDGIRATSDIEDKYKRGYFGAVPNINIYGTLQRIEETRK